jgi:hypothetical protein
VCRELTLLWAVSLHQHAYKPLLYVLDACNIQLQLLLLACSRKGLSPGV